VKYLLWLLTVLSRAANRIRLRSRVLFGGIGPLAIVPYRGYGTRSLLTLKGRVVEAKPIKSMAETTSSRENLLNMYRRLTRMPIPGVRVSGTVGGRHRETVTDEQGFFDLRFSHPPRLEPGYWQPVTLEMLSPRRSNHTTGEILTPPPDARMVIISDIDDTVVPTRATNILRLLRSLFLQNPRTRLPFPGVAAFYRALHLGRNDQPFNPILYVSRGPWNLYDLLCEFFNLHSIPIGPVLYLRDWGLSREGLSSATARGHKFRLIATMLEVYTELPFILIGDSGQKDPEIYTEVVREHPGRVLAVYIRRVGFDPHREKALVALAEEVRTQGSSLVLADDTLQMARHAASMGWIEEHRIADLVGEKVLAQEPPSLTNTAFRVSGEGEE
jgi:phosphatidate phosphatase APP1